MFQINDIKLAPKDRRVVSHIIYSDNNCWKIKSFATNFCEFLLNLKEHRAIPDVHLTRVIIICCIRIDLK